ncbi:hypothetical protein D3C81_1978040 [compost metagenome]
MSVKQAMCWMPSPLYASRYSLIWLFGSDDSLSGMRTMPSGAVIALDTRPVLAPLMSK